MRATSTPTERLTSMLYRHSGDTARHEWACYTLLNDLIHCDEATNEACWGDDPIPPDATMRDLIGIRFGYLPDNTPDLLDGSSSYDVAQQEVNSLLAYRMLMGT